MSKCDTCKVGDAVRKSQDPSCCTWYMDNVVIGDKSVEDCTEYEPKENK